MSSKFVEFVAKAKIEQFILVTIRALPAFGHGANWGFFIWGRNESWLSLTDDAPQMDGDDNDGWEVVKRSKQRNSHNKPR